MQYTLIHDNLSDALREVVQALGGSKRVGPALRPAKPSDDAARWLLDCLNGDRREELHPNDVLWLMREGRKIGCHAAISFMCQETGYAQPQPLDPRDEATELQRLFVQSVKDQQRLLSRLDSLGVVQLKVAS